MLSYFSDILRPRPMNPAGARGASVCVDSHELVHSAKDSDVRLALAARLVHLLPGLSQNRHAQLYAFAVQALGNLALDEVLKIRKALSATLKDHAYVPPHVASGLARDVERMVSEPILRFCSALSDRDLMDLLKLHPASWVVEAVAGRPFVRDEPFFPVIEVDPTGGGTNLERSRSVLHGIVEQAREFPEWKKPMGVEKSLPVSVAKKMAGFVDDSIRDVLMGHDDFDGQMCNEIVRVFRRRMRFVSDYKDTELSIETRLKTLVRKDALSEEVISDAAAMHDYDFVYGAIAHKAKTVIDEVQKVFELKAARSIVALCWRAGLSMRTAFALQRLVAQVPPKQLIYPRGGTDYPLSDGDLTWQLDFLGLRAA